MEHNIFITNSKAEHFDFDLEIKGLSGQDVSVRLVLHSDPFNMMFPATSLGEGKWTLEFPAMPFLEPSTYKFLIEAVVDGYYFPAHEGTMTVSKSPEVYVKKDDVTMKVRNKKVTVADTEPATKPEEEKVKPATTPQPAPSIGDDKFKEIIDRLKKGGAENPDAKKEEKKSEPEKAEDKKEEPKKEDVKEKEDPLAAAKRKADELLTETPKAKKKETPAKKAPAKTKADPDKVRQIIAETKQEQQQRKERETQRKQRLNEEAKKKAEAAKQQEKKEEIVAEEKKPSEKDLAAKAILESAKKPVENQQPQKKVAFKKGNTVTK